MPVYKLLQNKTTTFTGSAISLEEVQDSLSIQINLTGTGALTAVVNTEVSADGIAFQRAAVSNMSGTGSAAEAFTIKDPWMYIRCSILSISGTSATVNATMVV